VSDFLRLLVILMAAVNPPAVVLAMWDKPERPARAAWRVPLMGGCIGGVILVVAVLVSGSLLDWLAIAPESFRVAAGVVMAVAGALVIWQGRWGSLGHVGNGIETAIFPLALPLIAGPAALVAAISYGVDEGRGETIVAALIAAAVAALLVAVSPARARPALDAIARTLGALLVAVAAGLIVSGVRAI
jgi:multiple antibiotic resistance protein